MRSGYIHSHVKKIYYFPKVSVVVQVGKKKKETFTNWYLATFAGDNIEQGAQKQFRSNAEKFLMFTRKKRHLADVKVLNISLGEFKCLGIANNQE